MSTKEQFLALLKTEKDRVSSYIKLCKRHDVSEKITNLYNEMNDFYCDLTEVIKNKNLSPNYTSQLQHEIVATQNYFPLVNHKNPLFFESTEHEKLERVYENLLISFNKMQFSLSFFKKLGFLEENIVAIGANGSGKTSLAEKLKTLFIDTGVVISAQKNLLIPKFSTISSTESTESALKIRQQDYLDSKSRFDSEADVYSVLNKFGAEFRVLLANLLAERNSFANQCYNGQERQESRLDRAIVIWNQLIEHRKLHCPDGVNLLLKCSESQNYEVNQMSDGEKVILYYIAHILQAPESGFIVVDEPEMYLHKTLVTKLWDILETERDDCIFIYLTHDFDFATTRTAKKIWIKSFTHPETWDFEPIPENDIPEKLLMELLGSRKNILFCEGEKGSIDEKIYNILFPHFTVMPLEGCFEVINQTKAFNKLENVTTKAFGIIDSDHHGEKRLSSLKSSNIFPLSVAEAENLLMDEKFLEISAKQYNSEDEAVEKIKRDVIEKLKQQQELQVSNYVSTKINYYFTSADLSKANTLKNLQTNHEKYTKEVKLDDWFKERNNELEKIIREEDYKKALTVLNNKGGLIDISNKNLGITNFIDKSMRLLRDNEIARNEILKYFTDELKENS